MQKNGLFVLVWGVIIVGMGIAFWAINCDKKTSISTQNIASKVAWKTVTNSSHNNGIDHRYLLDGFPVDIVPLYKAKKVTSNKIFVRTDKYGSSPFGDANYTYYNVVFDSDASQQDFWKYYSELLQVESINTWENVSDQIKWTVWNYKVTVSNYENVGYIKVFLTDYKSEDVEKFFLSMPNIIDDTEMLIKREKTYWLLNQVWGQIEFSEYYDIVNSGDQDGDGKDDINELEVLKQQYQKQLWEEQNFLFDESTGRMTRKEWDVDFTMTVSSSHNRVYLMMRKPIPSS